MPTTKAPHAFTRLAPAKPTKVYDTYWRFAAERQAVFFRRLSGQEFPWTKDPILREFKFTNAYRASDRVSQYLLQKVIYAGSQTRDDVFFRTILFKIFNRIETWSLISQQLGEIVWSASFLKGCSGALSNQLARGVPVYSAAYIMPSGTGKFRMQRKHETHLKLIDSMMRDELPDRIADARNMRDVFMMLKSYPTIGDFLAYQYAIDINYSCLTSFSEMEFVMPGPGARDGLRKCFDDLGGLNEEDMIRMVADRQEAEFSRLGLHFQTLWGRRLQLIDCQNLFCEVDKYSRVAHPEVCCQSGRTRIKQRFTPDETEITYWYPPKWGINEQIKNGMRSTPQ